MSGDDGPRYHPLETPADMGLEMNSFIVGVLVFMAFLVLLYMLWVSCAKGDLTSHHQVPNTGQFIVPRHIKPKVVAVEANGPEESFRILQEYDMAKTKQDPTLCSSCKLSRCHSEKRQSVPTVPAYDTNSRTNLMAINMELLPPQYPIIN